MYTPARSDLIALALSAIATVLLATVINTAESLAAGISAFVAIPFVPLLAAWLSGPPHSLRSRFLFRGVAAVTGMAAALLIGGLTADTYDTGRALNVLGALIWTVPFAPFSLLLILITSTLLNRDRHTHSPSPDASEEGAGG